MTSSPFQPHELELFDSIVGTKIAVLSDSLGAVAPHTSPSWPERLERMLNSMGTQVTVKNFSINQHTFFQAYTEALYGNKTAVQAAIAWKPDIVIVSYGWNDAIVQADSRTVAQIKTDAEDVFGAINSALPGTVMIFAEHMPYDNVNFDSAVSIKNKGLAPAYMQKPSAGIYANTWTDTMLETTVTAGLLNLFADYDDVINHVKTNIPKLSGSISLHYFYCARLGLCASDGLHFTELGQQVMASFVLKELQTITAFTNLVNPIVDQQIAEWVDPDVLFAQYLTPSGDGFTVGYPGTPSFEQVTTQWSRAKEINPQYWFQPYKFSVMQYPFTIINDVVSVGSIVYVNIMNGPPNEIVSISIAGGGWIGLSGVTTDNNGNALYRYFGGNLGLPLGASNVRFLVGDQVSEQINITMA